MADKKVDADATERLDEQNNRKADPTTRELVLLRETFSEDLEVLLDALPSVARIEDFLARVEVYAKEFTRIATKDPDDEKENWYLYCDIFETQVLETLSAFLTDEHRKFIVGCHAGGLTTTDAVRELAESDPVINLFVARVEVEWQPLSDKLVHHFSYLKPTNPRWSERKYGQTWREARERYKAVISDLPYSSAVEQVALLSEQVGNILSELELPMGDAERHKQRTLLLRTVEALRKYTPTKPSQLPVDDNLSERHIVAVLERGTLALKQPAHLAIGGSGKEDIVNLLEQLLNTTKDDTPKAIVENTADVPESE